MRLSHYLLALVVLAAMGIYTVGLHVRRVESGYRIRQHLDVVHELERERDLRRLQREREAATERMVERARRMGILTAREVEAEPAPADDEPRGRAAR